MRDKLRLFTNQPLTKASDAFLQRLGIQYTPLVKDVPQNDLFKAFDFSFQYVNEARAAVETIWHIGYVDDRTFQDSIVEGGSQSLSIYACEIKTNTNFPRGLAVALTRAFTRVNTRQVNFNYDMPVVVIMKQGSLLTLATCELTDRLDGNGKKVGKVTMLRNMDCNNLHAGHRQILERIANDVQGCMSYDDLHKRWFSSFSIDVLSDKFFEGYKAIYEDIIEYVTGKRMVKEKNLWKEHDNGKPCIEIMSEFSAFPDPEKAVRDYVKNLMGRLVFIQFLQKKRWMGVPAGDSWEGGDPEFLQNLFKNSDKKETFVDDVLEPLFNDLNTKRHGDLVTNQNLGENIKVPYLNGGLFELDESDDTTFPLPSRFMKQLLDFFADYNFTIDENAPDDVEIGVDPEMLGRIFENLLEDNKDKGAFYTPKEIVQFMCRESLIAYLTTCVMKKQGENHRPEKDIREAVRKLLSEPEIIVPKMTPEHLNDFGTYIREVKICDPAIGSGAFPMGLLNELVRCRTIINAWAIDSYGNMLVGNIAALKAEIICNNIYGVDIEKGAIDIARLRFWLSIIVDEKTPEALPNFDYKFMQGNSLIPTFAGQYINLSTKNQQHKYVQQMIAVKEKIHQFKQRFYSASGEDKMKLNVLIKDHILQLISLQLGYEIQSWADSHREQLSISFDGAEKVTVKQAISQLPDDRRHIVELGKSLRGQLADESISLERRAQIDIQFFDWKLMFTEVFDVKDEMGGFDIVIGNPPYFVYEGRNHEDVPVIREQEEYEIAFGGKLNAYKLFLACALKKLIKKDGINCFIFQNSFMADLQAVNLRKYILDRCQILQIDSFPERDSVKKRVFESVKMSVCICLIRNSETNNSFVVNVWNDKNKTSGITTRFCADEIEKIDTRYLTIPRLKEEAKPIIIKMIGQRTVTVKCLEGELNVTTHRPYFSNDSNLPVIMKGAGIQKYYYTFDMSQGQIEYLDEKGYLQRYGSSEKAHHHEQSRIVMQGMTGANDKIRLVMSIIPPNIYLGHSCKYILPSDDISQKCLLGLMNSKLANFFFRCFSTNSNVNGYEIEAIPICKIPPEIGEKVEAMVSQLLIIKANDHAADTSEIESQIDHIMYHLYGLTYDEVLIVDAETPISRDEFGKY